MWLFGAAVLYAVFAAINYASPFLSQFLMIISAVAWIDYRITSFRNEVRDLAE